MAGETESVSGGSEDSPRRQFLIRATGLMTLLCSAIVGVPLVGSFIGPSFRITKRHWIEVADVASLPVGQPVDLKVPDALTDAYVRESVIRHMWVVKQSDAQVAVFSPICPHLGCHYAWNPASRHFECPCHGSVYTLDGTVLGGPAPRRLDKLPVRIEKGRLSVEWVQFRSGTPAKIPV